jgi:hypothetical protein
LKGPGRRLRRGRLGAAAAAVGLVLALGAGAAGAGGAFAKGDVNGDGSVDAGDVLLLQQALQGRVTLTPAQAAAADVAPMVGGRSQPDGVVNEADLMLLIRALEGVDVDGDGLGPAAEQQGGTSLFSSDTNGDGIPDSLEDSDGDGLDAFEEQALGSSSADPSGIGYADPAYTPIVPTPAYPAGTGPLVLFYASRPSADLPRMAPLRQLLLADGYRVADFTDAPPPANVDLSYFPQYCPSAWTGCAQYVADFLAADVFVLVEPSQAIDATEANAISMLLAYAAMPSLSIGERGGNAQALVSQLGAAFQAQDVTHVPVSCPPGLGTCPAGWSTFRTADATLDPTSPIVAGANPTQTLSTVTAFLAGALGAPPPPQDTPDTRHPATYRPVLQYGPGSTGQTPAGPVDAAGLAAGLSVHVPRNLCKGAWTLDLEVKRRFFAADVELLTSLVDGTGARRGFLAPGRNDDQQMALNLFHWLDESLDPIPNVPLFQQITADDVCAGSQTDDPTYNPVLASPAYAAGTGPRWLVDSGHANASTLASRYQGFGKLLGADGYRVEDSPNTFDQVDFSGVRGLVIVDPGTAISAAEFQYVFDFVQSGGSLLLVVDHAPFTANVAQAAPLLGIDFPTNLGPGVVSEPPVCTPFPAGCMIRNIVYALAPQSGAEGTILGGHPVVDGRSASEKVSMVRSFLGSAFQPTANASQIGVQVPVIVYPPDAAFLFTGIPAAGMLEGMAIQIGAGRVYVSSESAMFTAQIKGYTQLLDANGQPVFLPDGSPEDVPYGYFGMNSEPGDQQLLLNVIHWLDHLD